MEYGARRKIVAFIGEYGIGKTWLRHYIIDGSSPSNQYGPTTVCEDASFTVGLDNVKGITIRDTAGQEMYRSLVPTYVRGLMELEFALILVLQTIGSKQSLITRIWLNNTTQICPLLQSQLVRMNGRTELKRQR
jgi:hypothetical protein